MGDLPYGCRAFCGRSKWVIFRMSQSRLPARIGLRHVDGDAHKEETTMGEHFMGNLTNGFRNVTVSRKRALQLMGGAFAVAAPAAVSPVPQPAEAGKQRKPP